MTDYTISIVSDTVCPWCYIGLRRLQTAVAQHQAKYPADSFALRWHPFQLNPHLPEARAAERRVSHRRESGGGDVGLVSARLQTAGQDAGVRFSFTKARPSNTLDSHRLIEYAGYSEGANDIATVHRSDQDVCESPRSRGIQTRLAEELFAGYFEQEMDVEDHTVLVRAAGRAGLDETEVKRFLESDALAEQVQKQAYEARVNGVHSVPQFTINALYTIEGAQEPAAFLMLFERWKKKQSKI